MRKIYTGYDTVRRFKTFPTLKEARAEARKYKGYGVARLHDGYYYKFYGYIVIEGGEI